MIKHMGPAGETAFLRLLNKTHLEHTRPQAWRQQDTQPIPKPKDPSNPRLIALVSCIEKTGEKMVLNRIKYKIGPLHKQLYAYQEGLGTSECITEVLSCINQNKATIVFIDFEKAFELASPTAMLQSVAKKGVKGHLLAWTKNYVLGRQARVKFQGVVSTYHELENGTPQGGILSPLLFNILMENIASFQLPEGVDIFVYADDVCVIARGAVRTMKMQRALNAISHKSNELGLKINIDHSNNIKRLGLAGILLQLNPDTAQSIQYIPPWKKQLAKFSYTKLPRAKENCTIEELRNAATAAMQTAETIGAQIYYTDGTVDPRTQTAGAAVHSCNFTACWRTSNNVSTLQTELVAIQQALRYSIENEEGPVVIHTDSRSSMQALQQDKNKENKSLIADIKSLLYQHNERNRLVTFNWIPSHIGIPGNEKADELAKSTRHIQNIQVHIQPALQQIKNKIKTHPKDNLIKDLHMWAENGSPSATWYKWATELEPPPIDKNTPRKQAVCIHRLRLGYKANWEIREDIQRPCDHCGDTPQHALLHYLLECRETAQLRGDLLVDTNAPEAGKAAATLAKAIVESFDTHSQLLSRLPPPR
ncbi:uncharacterized protein [Palaemon carinicauda]|uniref:uncharacterized protein n=1 Tax=Palaemon carinicauda TaxID=392227 RepID=UPI0035B572FA